MLIPQALLDHVLGEANDRRAWEKLDQGEVEKESPPGLIQ